MEGAELGWVVSSIPGWKAISFRALSLHHYPWRWRFLTRFRKSLEKNGTNGALKAAVARGTTQVTPRPVRGGPAALAAARREYTRSLASRPPVLRTSSALTPRDAPAFREPHLVGSQAGLALNLRAVRRTSSSLSLKDDLFRANSLSQS